MAADEHDQMKQFLMDRESEHSSARNSNRGQFEKSPLRLSNPFTESEGNEADP